MRRKIINFDTLLLLKQKEGSQFISGANSLLVICPRISGLSAFISANRLFISGSGPNISADSCFIGGSPLVIDFSSLLKVFLQYACSFPVILYFTGRRRVHR
ncbi:hypothetical protein [Metabacillus sp. RGM 3146]|uniref:hypothetical protein n=1 Tax=Metabacillus sp. RGM 3146 TaxID=3401092 RepID=UPI003B9DA987